MYCNNLVNSDRIVTESMSDKETKWLFYPPSPKLRELSVLSDIEFLTSSFRARECTKCEINYLGLPTLLI